MQASAMTGSMIHFPHHPSVLLLASWRPFVTPAPLWDYWWLLLFALLASVAIVYKCTKVSSASRIPGEAAQLWFSAVVAMLLGAAALFALVYLVLD